MFSTDPVSTRFPSGPISPAAVQNSTSAPQSHPLSPASSEATIEDSHVCSFLIVTPLSQGRLFLERHLIESWGISGVEKPGCLVSEAWADRLW